MVDVRHRVSLFFILCSVRRRRCFFSSRGWFSATLFLLLFVVVRYARKGPPSVGHRKTQWIFIILQSSSTRPRCEKKADHDTKTSSKRRFPGDQKSIFSLLFRSRDASRTGWSKTSRLECHVGSIFVPKRVQNWWQKLKNQVGQVSLSQKSRWSGLFVLFVLLVSSRLVVLVVPGGLGPIGCRVTASHALVRGGPRRNDPPCPSRWVKAVPLVPLCLLSLLRLVCFCSPSLWV